MGGFGNFDKMVRACMSSPGHYGCIRDDLSPKIDCMVINGVLVDYHTREPLVITARLECAEWYIGPPNGN